MIRRGTATFGFTIHVSVLTSSTQDMYLMVGRLPSLFFILPSPVFSPYLMFTNRIDKDVSAAAHEAPGSNEAAPPSKRVVVSDDEVEAAITRARGRQMLCRECGPRPEPDAVYCSSCGVLLAAR